MGCGGDGTIGWILQEADKLGVTNVSSSHVRNIIT